MSAKSVLGAVIITFLFFVYVNGAAPDATCKEFVGALTKKQLGGISGCSKSMKFKNPKEKSAKMNCILKCVLIKEGLLNAEGVFDNDAFEKTLNEMVPGNLMEKARPMFESCRDKTASGLDGSGADEYCKTYDPLIKCMLETIGNLCK